MDYVTWTYFFRRLIMNPSFYQLEETSSDAVNTFLSRVVAKSLTELESSYCIEVEEVSECSSRAVFRILFNRGQKYIF